MNDTIRSMAVLMRTSLSDPKEAARRVLSLPMPRDALWQALALVVILSLLMTHLGDRMMADPADPLVPLFRDTPLLTVAILGGLTVLTVFAVHRIGRAFGGTGDFEGALRIVIWIQLLMLVVQAAQLLFLVVLPPVAVLLGPLGLILSLWLLTNFIAVLHGFTALAPVFVMIIVSAFGLAFLMFFLLSIIGIDMTTEVPNV